LIKLEFYATILINLPMLPKSYSLFIWHKALLPILDFLTIILFFFVAYQMRYVWYAESELLNPVQVTSFKAFNYFSILFAFLCVIYFALAGLYKVKNRPSRFRETLVLAFGVALIMGWFIVYFYFSEYDNNFFPINGLRNIKLSRFLASFGIFVVIIGLYLQRLALFTCKVLLTYNNYFISKVAVAGYHPDNIIESLRERPDLRVRFVYPNLDDDVYNELIANIKEDKVDQLYLNSEFYKIEELLVICERFKVVTMIYDANLAKLNEFTFEPQVIKDSIYMALRYSKLDGWGVVFKRLFDIAFSLSFVIAFSPLYLLIILAIVIEDKGNPFYMSQRVGPNGKNFNVFKFRRLKMADCTTENNQEALKKEAELIKTNDMRNDGVLYKIKNDPRATKVGSFLEKTSLDEIPQFFNVLIGNLSVVGPRPHQPREVAKYQQHHFKVLNIKPGITGLAQINGRSDLSFNDEVAYDTEYVRNWSFFLDLKIIIMTPLKLLKGHKN
jgi:exopolysaccharide biosynthesis polyprenyl glycosylphosphotransferase